jgi:hypothetical protein
MTIDNTKLILDHIHGVDWDITPEFRLQIDSSSYRPKAIMLYGKTKDGVEDVLAIEYPTPEDLILALEEFLTRAKTCENRVMHTLGGWIK